MYLELNEEKYKVNIVKKVTTKNTYIRVNDDLEIMVTTNIFVSNKEIEKVINDNINSISKMIDKTKLKKQYNSKFYYLGNEYNVVYTNSNTVEFGTNKVFIDKNIDIDKFLSQRAKILFAERLYEIYSGFSRSIPYPTLTIRRMKSRWGVCNTKTKRITLNLELIRKDISCLDYVIVHELSHLIHPNHSKDFWLLVEENFPEYKKTRKMMKEY